ncbi:cytochrome P450 9e2-like [Trichogramma pretiosum]|uniref:cytochrome P450 9e2-like n=1 Tax=Trichogramma pretiosum TaxID=7493 RepID=UPI0006C96548|nr:cytochrome P450 9e2-like [Trichogramma pretiosum]
MYQWLWALALSALIYLIFKINEFRKRFVRWGVPGPVEVPFLGIFGEAYFTGEHFTSVLTRLYNYDKRAKYVGCHFFTKPHVIPRDLDLIKSILVKNFDHFADQEFTIEEATDPLYAKNVFHVNGDKWKEARTVLLPFFTSSRMRSMHGAIDRVAERFTATFIEQYTARDAIDSRDIFARYICDVIASCAFGLEVDSLKNPANEFYFHGTNSVVNIGRLRFATFLTRIFPKLGSFFNITMVPVETSEYFVSLIKSIIEARRRDNASRPDALQLLIDAQASGKNWDIYDIAAQAYVFFMGGLDSSSTQMCWLAHELALNPRVQAKLQREIDARLRESNGEIGVETIGNMPYFDATFYEALRMHPFPILIRECSKEFELPPALPGSRPFLVRPEHSIKFYVPAYPIMRDPEHFERPDVFDPERFVENKIKTDVTNLGFGLGPRMCIGNRFALQQTKILFTRILSRCSFVPSPKTCVPTAYDKSNYIPSAAGGFWIKLQPRSQIT